MSKSAALDVITTGNAGKICINEIFTTERPRKITREKMTTWQHKIMLRGAYVGLAIIVALSFSLNALDRHSVSFA